VGRTQGIRIASVPLVLLLVVFAGAQRAADHHVSADPAQRLFRLSPFAHGYIHGYESGFGMGDEDVQMGRGEQKIRKTREYREADRGYERAFGERESFRNGFREGLTVGYHDAVSGGEFRALAELRRLATGLENDLVAGAADAPYDRGFFAGYRAARAEDADECKGAPGTAEDRFCSGFLDGYELGESDSGAIATARERGAPPLGGDERPRLATRSAPRR
jgi:hypothetical protein